MTGRIFVCITCDRYAPAPGVTRGESLAAAMKMAARARQEITVRVVECLNNCRQPCAAALRAPGKAVLRFANLRVEDVPALLDAARLHAGSADGDVATSALPASLRSKLSGRVSAAIA